MSERDRYPPQCLLLVMRKKYGETTIFVILLALAIGSWNKGLKCSLLDGLMACRSCNAELDARLHFEMVSGDWVACEWVLHRSDSTLKQRRCNIQTFGLKSDVFPSCRMIFFHLVTDLLCFCFHCFICRATLSIYECLVLNSHKKCWLWFNVCTV